MSSAMRVGRPPRYGSPAEVASYAGLSTKTIRRLVDAGKVRGHKVGRRVLIPYEDLDRHILSIEDHRRNAMSAAAPQVTLPRRATDDRGRLIPLSPEQARLRAEEALRALDDVATIGDEDERRTTFEALVQGLNEEPLSDRPRFRG
jgi:excisionase family DNA binding protein